MSDAKIQLSGGKVFDLLEPDPEMIDIESIAHSLSQLCRFTGHSSQFYSVAQHCVVVSRLVPAQLALQGLLHDAAEAFIGDVSTPLKQLLPDYKVIEVGIESAVAQRFRFTPPALAGPITDSVKHADKMALATERRDLGLPGNDEYWTGLPEPAAFAIVPLGPVEARMAFLARFAEIVLRPGQGQAPVREVGPGELVKSGETARLDPNRFETNQDRSERLAREEEEEDSDHWERIG